MSGLKLPQAAATLQKHRCRIKSFLSVIWSYLICISTDQEHGDVAKKKSDTRRNTKRKRKTTFLVWNICLDNIFLYFLKFWSSSVIFETQPHVGFPAGFVKLSNWGLKQTLYAIETFWRLEAVHQYHVHINASEKHFYRLTSPHFSSLNIHVCQPAVAFFSLPLLEHRSTSLLPTTVHQLKRNQWQGDVMHRQWQTKLGPTHKNIAPQRH